MEPKTAAALTDAIIRAGHPRSDYRTEEAKRYTRWLDRYARDLIHPGDRLLDLGCAAGKHTLHAAGMGARAVGLDCAFEALRFGQSVAVDIASRARFVQGVYAALPYPTACFDVVLFPKNLVECSYAEGEALAIEIARILKPGGRLVLTLPDCLKQYTAGSQLLAHYDPQTGRSENNVRIPGQGEYENPGYFWTSGYAVHVFERGLSCVRLMEMENSVYLMVFEKSWGLEI